MARLNTLAGTTVGSYELQDCLGHGSSTAVYRASTSDFEWAIKLVDSQIVDDGELVERLRREAAILDQIGHQGILPIQDAIRDQGITAAAMPLKRATTLHDLMAQGMDMESAWNILNQIAESLHLVHQRGLAYRVLKPLNVLIDEDGRAYLAEFGVTGQGIGQLALATPDFQMAAPQYLAPEQVEGKEVDYRADIYSFGVLVFELATGTPLLGVGAADTLRATLHDAPPDASARNPQLPPEVDSVLHRALARDPAGRHQSVWDLLEELVDPPPVSSGGGSAPSGASTTPALPELEVSGIGSEEQNILDSYFATCLRAGRRVADERWADIVGLAGLRPYVVEDSPEEGAYVPALLALSRLADAFEVVFGQDAPQYLSEWGGLANQQWLQSIQQKPPWIAGPPTGRLVDLLSVFIEALNRVRGEDLQEWKQVSRPLFRVVHEWNMTAVGRRRPAEACHFWKGAYEAGLRWAGLEKDWLVAEVECGCVTGTYKCVFTIVRADR